VKLDRLDPPRAFRTGRGEPLEIRDCGRLALEPDEQITFTTERGAEYDVCRKAWGFYATPSLNGRLPSFGLRPALVRGPLGKHFILLVERGAEPTFDAYLALERNEVVRWLDDDTELAALAAAGVRAQRGPDSSLACPCGANRFRTVHMYFSPPEGEIALPLPAGHPYRREIFQCGCCGHFVSFHDMPLDGLYGGQYVDSTYGSEEGLRRTFDRIVGLPEDRSDNHGRVGRVCDFAARHLPPVQRSVLDVGSGLCVFLHGMKARGWTCTALDPDPRAARHARTVVGVDAICGDFLSIEGLPRFDLVSFNKVLEHVRDPIAMLSRARPHLASGGYVYLELPDGEAAAKEGFGREEFFLEHFHVFTAASLDRLAERAGFRTVSIERLREPSLKLTLRAFLTRK